MSCGFGAKQKPREKVTMCFPYKQILSNVKLVQKEAPKVVGLGI